MEWAVNTTIKANAENTAIHWASHFDAELQELGTIVERGTLSESQQEVVNAAIDFTEVYSFFVFNPQGGLAFSTDYGVITPPAEQGKNDKAQAVLRSGMPLVEIIPRPGGADNPIVYVEALVPALGVDGFPIGVIGLFMDQTESAAVYTNVMSVFGWIIPALCAVLYAFPALAYVMKREQVHARTKKVATLSRFDQLTGALNRQTMSVEAKGRFATRQLDELIGVFFVDVDQFKSVNDEFGHEFGDAYLQNIASLLMKNVRKGDLVGRMGGDEFVVALPKATSADMEQIGNRVVEASRLPFEYRGTTIQSSVSIGYHLSPHGETPQSALHAADLALFHAKATGRSKLVQYFPQLDTAMERRRKVEARLREAVAQGGFEIVFQPIMDANCNTIAGFEALLRLNGKDGEPIPPAEFIPIAEEIGVIHEIGTFVLGNAIKSAQTWPEHVFVSVNLSLAQFRQGNFVEHVANILSELNFPPSRLELEVTEGLLMADEQRISDQLIGLKKMGISIAMDDFGTGYSSLGYLWKYDFDKLKIDRVFLEGFDFDQEKYGQIIKTIVIVGHQMGMKVTVEGVETASQYEMLDQLACDHYQGFYFGKPIPANQIWEILGNSSNCDTSRAG